MENILAAIILIFILLFGALTLSNAFLSAQDTVQQAWADATDRDQEMQHTAIEPQDVEILNAGSLIEVTLRNSGSLKLMDFDRWDVFVEYYDDAATPVYHVERLAYNPMASNNEWAVKGIYLDAAQDIKESYEPGIVDPGEEMLLDLYVSPAVGQTAQVTVATDSGIRASLIGMVNQPPTLPVDTGIKVAAAGSTAFTPDTLQAVDTDNTDDQLTYTVVTPPEQGTLPDEFTQAQIDDGKVVYTHTGTDADSFEFTVSDGINVIGPFTCLIAINQPPQQDVIAGLTLPADSTEWITRDMLHFTDPDVPPDTLVYTVTQFPSHGALSLGSTFTQQDIDSNRLTYTHIGSSDDLFKFVVSDGYDVIGSYTFLITLVETTPEP